MGDVVCEGSHVRLTLHWQPAGTDLSERELLVNAVATVTSVDSASGTCMLMIWGIPSAASNAERYVRAALTGLQVVVMDTTKRRLVRDRQRKRYNAAKKRGEEPWVGGRCEVTNRPGTRWNSTCSEESWPVGL